MGFKKWLAEVGMGGGGPGSGMAPPLQRPDLGAMLDYHGDSDRDPRRQDGKLPPVKRKRFGKRADR